MPAAKFDESCDSVKLLRPMLLGLTPPLLPLVPLWLKLLLLMVSILPKAFEFPAF